MRKIVLGCQFLLIALPALVLADQETVANLVEDCSKPAWLDGSNTAFLEDSIITFPDAISLDNEEQLTIDRSEHPSLRVEARIPRPSDLAELPSHFFVMISTPTGEMPRASVAQIHNHSALKRRLLVPLDADEQRTIKRNYNLARDIHTSNGLLQHFKPGVDIRTGNTSYIKTFWRTATGDSYDSVIDPEYSDHSAPSQNNVILYDHLYGFNSFPDDVLAHYHSVFGHKVELEKITSSSGKAYAFILNPEGECMFSNDVSLVN